MGETLITFEIGPNPPPRLDKALGRDVPEDASLSRSRLAKLIAEGAVKVDGVVVTDPRHRVAEGAKVSVTVAVAEDSHIGAENIPLDVVFEDDDVIVVDKPAGMVVHPAPGSPNGTLVNALLHHFGGHLSGVGGEKRPGIVHRIDKDTSGLLVVAKTARAHHGLATQFEDHSVERSYVALVHGAPDVGDPRLRGIRGVSSEPGNVVKITTQLARHRTDRQRQAVLFNGGRHAVTRVKITECYGAPTVASAVECRLETGRTHQIRVHMAHIGHGLIGDPVYGGRRKIKSGALHADAAMALAQFSRQALHARVLGFVHPVTGQRLRFEMPIPLDMADLIGKLLA